mgnify:CR=1 FL=1
MLRVIARIVVHMGEKMTDRHVTETTSFRVGYLLLLNGNMSQKELAMALGVTPNKLNHKLVERSRWSVEDLLALSDFFGVSLDFLVGRTSIEEAVPVNERTSTAEAVEVQSVHLSPRPNGSVPPEGFEPPTYGTGNRRSIP